MLLTVFSTKDTGGSRLLRIPSICPKTYWTEGLHFVGSYCVCHAKANSFPKCKCFFRKLFDSFFISIFALPLPLSR